MAYNPEEDIKVSDLPEKTTDVVSDDKLLVIDSEDANILKQVDASKVWWWWSGTWDMLKSVYDTNDNGIVDNAEALWWVPASDYATKTWIKTINNQSLIWEWNITIEWWSGTVDTAMSDTSTNAVQNKVIKGYVDNAVAGVTPATVDTAMSDTSNNPVRNKTIKAYVDNKTKYEWVIWRTDFSALETSSEFSVYYEDESSTEWNKKPIKDFIVKWSITVFSKTGSSVIRRWNWMAIINRWWRIAEDWITFKDDWTADHKTQITKSNWWISFTDSQNGINIVIYIHSYDSSIDFRKSQYQLNWHTVNIHCLIQALN